MVLGKINEGKLIGKAGFLGAFLRLCKGLKVLFIHTAAFVLK